VKSVIRPAVLLKSAGLIELGPGGGVKRWQAGVLAAGGLAAIYQKDPKDTSAYGRIATVLDKAAADSSMGIRAVHRADVSEREGGFTGASFVLEAQEGFEFETSSTGPPVAPSGDKGAHGYPPENPDMYASLIAAGAGIRTGAPLARVSMLAIAPTVARLLGVKLQNAEAAPLAELLSEPLD
jgi:hypothetical protein